MKTNVERKSGRGKPEKKKRWLDTIENDDMRAAGVLRRGCGKI